MTSRSISSFAATISPYLVASILLSAQAASLTNAAPSPASASKAVDWTDRAKHPASWMGWGADLRLRGEYLNNVSLLSHTATDHELNYQRYRPRVWTKLTPLPQVELNARLVWEFRTYIEPDSRPTTDWDEGLFDQMNIKVNNLFEQPLALTVGRQDFTFGNKWLVWEATATDGTRTDFFDAARLTWDGLAQKTKVDAIYVDMPKTSDHWLPVISSTGKPFNEQDERGAILYVSNKSLPKTQLDGYFMYRHEYNPLPKTGDAADIYLFGGRAEGDWGQHWTYRGEFAEQLGRKNGTGLSAFGVNGRLSYFVKDSWNHNFRLGYEYLSGDDPNTRTDEGWDSMWARRAQWSELLGLTWSAERRGRKSDWTNLQRLDAGWSCNPSKRVEVLVDYMPLFANSNPMAGNAMFGNEGRFRGQLVTAIVKFVFSQHVTGHLWSEFFLPGNYYSPSHRDMATFLRAELLMTF